MVHFMGREIRLFLHTHVGMLFIFTNACYFLRKNIFLKCLLMYYTIFRIVSVNVKV